MTRPQMPQPPEVRPLPVRRRASRLWWALPLLVAALLALHTGLWRGATSAMQQGFEDWAAQRRAQGWVITHATPQRGGWPFSATLILPDMQLARSAPPAFRWQAEAVELRLTPTEWGRIVVAPRGRQRLGVARGEIPFAADRLELTLPLERGPIPREAELEVERLRLNSPWGPFEMRRGRLSAQTRLTATESEPVLALDGTAEDILLPRNGPGALGNTLARLALEGSLSGPLPPVRHLRERAEAWRDAGGTLEIRHLDGQWGPVGLALTGTGTLDDALQPMGAGQLRVTGAGEALDALAALGWIQRNAVTAGRALAVMLSRPGADGGAPVLELPFTVQERRLALSHMRLGRMPEIAWPAPPPEPDAARDPSLPSRD
ncbi:DUF2125 domain-containing protein [Rhodovarius crocodyli]|nr:DUF2125 domain-containing protein [Rhodovarius crocodyli]